jgi:hypothetical protein
VQKPQRSTTPDSDQEYRAIEVTLLETSRGRWFLAEHGRRARRLDNALLEDALHRLKSSLRPPEALVSQVRGELESLRSELDAVRAALVERPVHMPSAGTAQPEAASQVQRILSAAESVHELAWTLQGKPGRDFDQRTCEEIARQVVAIYALSRSQASQTETTLNCVAQLEAATTRIAALIDALSIEVAADPA